MDKIKSIEQFYKDFKRDPESISKTGFPHCNCPLVDIILEVVHAAKNIHFHFLEATERLKQVPNPEIDLGEDLRLLQEDLNNSLKAYEVQIKQLTSNEKLLKEKVQTLSGQLAIKDIELQEKTKIIEDFGANKAMTLDEKIQFKKTLIA